MRSYFFTHHNTRKRQNQSFLGGNCGCSSFHWLDLKPVTWTRNCTHSRVYRWATNYKINREIKEIWLQTDFFTVYKMVTFHLFRQMLIWSKHQLVKGVLIFLIRRKTHIYIRIFFRKLDFLIKLLLFMLLSLSWGEKAADGSHVSFLEDFWVLMFFWVRLFVTVTHEDTKKTVPESPRTKRKKPLSNKTEALEVQSTQAVSSLLL